MNTSLIKTAQYLGDLLRVDETLFQEDLQWQAQLLGNAAGHVFEHSGRDMRMSEAAERFMLEANLKLLTVNAELTTLKAKGKTLKEENEKLQREISALESRRKSPSRATSVSNRNRKGKAMAISEAMLIDIDFEQDASLANSLSHLNLWPSTSRITTSTSTSRLDAKISRTMELARQQLSAYSSRKMPGSERSPTPSSKQTSNVASRSVWGSATIEDAYRDSMDEDDGESFYRPWRT
jgi:hypothetical protein